MSNVVSNHHLPGLDISLASAPDIVKTMASYLIFVVSMSGFTMVK